MERWLQLILLLPENTFITYKELAELLGCSTRTVHDDVSRLNVMMKPYAGQLVTKPHYGVKLSVTKRESFSRFLQILKRDSHQNPSAQRRSKEIAWRFLQDKDGIKLDDLAETLYVTRAVIQRDLRQVRQEFLHYGLSLEHAPHRGIYVVGKETNIRRALVRLLEDADCGAAYSDREKLGQELQRLSDQMEGCFAAHHYKMATYAYHWLLRYLYLSVKRIRAGFTLGASRAVLPSCPIFAALSEEIAHVLERLYSVPFGGEERSFLCILLASHRVLSWGELSDTKEEKKLIEDMLEAVHRVFCYNLAHDFELIASLSTHLIPLQLRIRYQVSFDNPMLDETRQGNPLAYEMAKVACSILEREWGKPVPSDEVAYIALYFHIALERMKLHRKKRVLVLCGEGKGPATLLAHRIAEAYGKFIQTEMAWDLHALADDKLSAVDYVLSTIPIRNSVGVPVIELDSVFSDLQGDLFRDMHEQEADQLFAQYFSKERFFISMPMTSKQDILSEMCKACASQLELPEDFAAHVWQRELLGGTELGNSVAVPHPDKPMGKRSFIAVAILQKPILWEEAEVKFVFLISMKEGGDRNLPAIYRLIRNFMNSKEAMHRLAKHPAFEELEHLFVPQ